MTKLLRRQHYQRCLSFLRLSLSTHHNRILSCGAVVGLFYMAHWASCLLESFLRGESTPALNLGFLYVAWVQLWGDRSTLQSLQSYEEERTTGEWLILGGVGAFAVCQSSFSMQAVIWIIILTSMAWSHWGITFFRRFWLPTVLIAASQYPSYIFLSSQIWHIVTPPDLLESFMAWIGSLVFQTFGHPAVAQAALLSLAVPLDPAKSVLVASGCSGFDMAFTLATTGLILGLFFHLSRWTTLRIMAIGIGLALLFNIPRSVLLAIAVVYWGKDWFEFWHGPWGGQIFAGVLFTVYHYSIQGWIISPAPKSDDQ